MAAKVFEFKPTAVGILPRGDKYTVNDLGSDVGGYCELIKRELGVSRDGTMAHTRWVQIHELGHVHRTPLSAISIAKRHRLPFDYVNAAEDVRVNHKNLAAIPDALDGWDMPKSKIRADIVGYTYSYHMPKWVRTYCGSMIPPSVRDAIDAWIGARLRKVGRRATLSNFTIPLARFLGELASSAGVDGMGSTGGEPPGKPISPADAASEDRHGDAKPGKSDSDDLGDERPAGEGEEYSPESDPTHSSHADPEEKARLEVDWVIPKVQIGPFGAPAKRQRSHSQVPFDAGVSPRYIARHATGDTRLFARKLSKPGALARGTVLIDVSGSMSLSPHTVDAIVSELPQATVAIYSGIGTPDGSIIQVVARGGRKVLPRHYEIRGGNTCDGPALLWLSRQAMPRVFYCDGVVTGQNDHVTTRLTRQSRALIKAGRILWVYPTHREGSPAKVAAHIVHCARTNKSTGWERG